MGDELRKQVSHIPPQTIGGFVFGKEEKIVFVSEPANPKIASTTGRSAQMVGDGGRDEKALETERARPIIEVYILQITEKERVERVKGWPDAEKGRPAIYGRRRGQAPHLVKGI